MSQNNVVIKYWSAAFFLVSIFSPEIASHEHNKHHEWSQKSVDIHIAADQMLEAIYQPAGYGHESTMRFRCAGQSTNWLLKSDDLFQNDQYFRVDQSTGAVYIENPRKIKHRVYQVVLQAVSQTTETICHEEHVDFIFDHIDSAKRPKRQVLNSPPTQSPLKFAMRTVGGDPDRCRPGDTLHYQVDITPTTSDSVDIFLEIFTNDPLSVESIPVLSIYNISLNYDRSAISVTSLDDPKLQISPLSKNLHQRATIEIEGLKSNSPTLESNLTLSFSLIITRNDDSKTKNLHHLTVGAEYQEGRYVWIGQDLITYSKVRSDAKVTASVTGPTTAILGTSVVYTLSSKIAIKSENVKVEVSVANFDYEPENLVSLGLVGLAKAGPSFALLPQDSGNFFTQRISTSSGKYFYKSRFNMGYITSLAMKNGTFNTPNHADHSMDFRVAVHAINITENLEKIANISFRIFTGSKERFSETSSLRLTNGTLKAPKSSLVTLEGHLDATNLTSGDLASVLLNVSLRKLDTFTVIEGSLISPKQLDQQYPFSSCAARLVPGQDIPNLPYYDSSWVRAESLNESGQVKFLLHGIHLVKVASCEETQVSVEVALVVIGGPQSEVPIQISLRIADSSQSDLVFSSNTSIVEAEKGEESSVRGNVERTVPWKELFGQGGLALESSIILPPKSNYSDLRVSMKFKPEDPKDAAVSVKVCRFEIMSIGEALPCTQALLGEIKAQAKSTANMAIEENEIKFSDVCVGNTTLKQTAARSIVSVFSIQSTGNASVRIEGQLEFALETSRRMIWNQILPTSVVLTEPPPKQYAKPVKILAYKTIPDSVGIGRSTTGSIMILLAEGSLGPLSVEVYISDPETSKSSICGLTVKSVGYNMPCFKQTNQSKLEGKEKGQNTRATLDLGVVGNYGPTKVVLPASDSDEANRIRIQALVNLGEDSGENQRFDVVVRFGKQEERSAFLVPINKYPSLMKGLPRRFEVANSGELVPIGGPAIVRLKLGLRPQTMVQPIIKLPKSGDYQVFDAAVSKVGQSFPCYAPKILTKDSGMAVINLGVITNARPLPIEGEDSLIHQLEDAIEVSLAIKMSQNLASNQSVDFRAVISNPAGDGEEEAIGSLIAVEKVSEKPPESVAISHTQQIVALERRQTKWIPINVTISPNTRARLDMVVWSELVDSRPLISIRGLGVAASGLNLPTPGPAIVSSNLMERSNRLHATLDYVANFGFSHLFNGTPALGDDDLVVQVLVQMMDHPKAEAQTSRFHFSVLHGNESRTYTERKFSLQASDSSVCRVNLAVNEVPETFKRNQTIPIELQLGHATESNLEPSDLQVRFFMPHYISFFNLSSCSADNISVETSQQGSSFHVKIVVDLVVDPQNIIGYGRGLIPTTIPIAVFYNGSVVSSFQQIIFSYQSEECFQLLELKRCQITASSALNHTQLSGPSQATSQDFWTPSLAPSFAKSYLEYRFFGETRVTAVRFTSPKKQRKATSFHVEISEDTENWIQVGSEYMLTSSGESETALATLGLSIETKHLRLYIDSAEPLRHGEDLLQLKVDLLGCPLEDTSETCSSEVSEWSSPPLSQSSKKLVTDWEHNIVYACDFIDNPKRSQCLASHDDGDSWQLVSPIVHSLLGFDSKLHRTIALDRSARNYLYSVDGQRWTPIESQQVQLLTTSGALEKPILVGESFRDWSVSGLNISHSKHVKMVWRQSCR